MNLKIQGRQYSINQHLHNYIKEKVLKLKTYFDHIVNVHIVLGQTKIEYIAEINLSAGRHHFHNKVKTDEMYKSVDKLLDKIEDQIKRYKEYITSHKGGGVKELIASELQAAQMQENVTVLEGEVPSKPMDELEAILQLKTDGKKIFGFYPNESKDHASFIYTEDSKTFIIYSFNKHWEKKNVHINEDNKSLNIDMVESFNLIKDSLETAVEYMIQENTNYKIFESARTGKVFFLFKQKDNAFKLLREI